MFLFCASPPLFHNAVLVIWYIFDSIIQNDISQILKTAIVGKLYSQLMCDNRIITHHYYIE